MLMGDLLAAARRSTARFENWLREADPKLAERLVLAASADQTSPGEWLRISLADFDRLATEEDWATLVSRLRNDPDPGARCLLSMLEWRLGPTEPAPVKPSISAFRSGQGGSDERNTRQES